MKSIGDHARERWATLCQVEEKRLLRDCAGTRNPRRIPYAWASEMMLRLEERRQSAVERPDEVALEAIVVRFFRPAMWLFPRLDAVHVQAGPA